jgi:DNA helicase-2/ATP-dependent DNA helicase PcrA
MNGRRDPQMDLFSATSVPPAPQTREPEASSALVAGLNPQQREAVLATEGAVLILAGAGSGKTRVITSRVAHLILEKGIDPDAILAVTFTNKAAAEMKARVEALLQGRALTAWVSTFHSLCVRLLRREGDAAGIGRDFVIYDDDDQMSAMREALRQLDLSEKLNPPRRILSRVSALKNSGRDREVEDEAGRFQDIRKAYLQILASARALDFDDLLLKTRELLAEKTDVRERYQRRFRYVLVDEYQDTNRVQYDIVRFLAGGSGNLTVVGDEDQSIYSWRGADINNILDFERDFPGARVLRLEQNYRSTQAILDTASGLVGHNERRKGKTLYAVKTGGEPVRLHHATDEFEEAAWVVKRIRAQSGRTAILYRTNAQSRLLEEALLRSGIAYTVVGGVGFYERKEVKDVLAYLRLLQNRDDSVAFRRVLNTPPRGIGAKTLAELESRSARERISAWDALELTVDEAVLPARATQPLQRFRELILALRDAARQQGPRGLIETVLAQTGYSAALADEDSQESQDRLENLAELLSAAADFETRVPGAGLAGFLDQVSLLSELDVPRRDAPVVLMTLHSAKGLEFDAVFLVGLEDGLLPHSRSIGVPDALEEERRLCYVGMTRAMERLHLTSVRSRQVFGQRRIAEPSRFLRELPPAALEVTGDDIAPPAPMYGRRDWPRHDRPAAPVTYAVDDGTSGPELRPGTAVRHPLFGVGTVVRCEGAGADLKVTVSFRGIGAKKLVARFAALEPL